MSDKSERAGVLLWLDQFKAIALIWILINHLVERLMGSPYFGNPFPGWPPLSEQIAQLRPVQGYGLLDLPLNALRYIGWTGDQGVQLFLLVSGFGLTWGLLARRRALGLRDYYMRRAGRIFPMWWGAHALFMGTLFVIGWGLDPFDRRALLSLIGLRITPDMLYYFAPAWWFFGLLIQLYLIFPILWVGLRRLGPFGLLVVCGGLGFAARLVGLLTLDGWLDAWNRGAIFITQLPSFALGISLAAWMQAQPEQAQAWLRSGRAWLAGVAVYLAGLALSFSLPGMAFAPFLTGLGLFLILFNALRASTTPVPARPGPLGWIGRHSLSLFLVHHPLILFLVPERLTPANLGFAALASLVAVALTFLAAVFLEWLVSAAERLLVGWYRRHRLFGLALRVAGIGLVAAGALLGAELAVRQFAPQEVFGWGERPALIADEEFGWRLKPSTETRLRWQSYDYVVTANSLGFPGPEYPPEKSLGALRILTTGDAFTSAEGVDTPLAWPRLLESDLAGRLPGRKVEVLNFAMTGYGPNQYQAVVERFAPIYRPDLIVIGLYANDYEDVLISNARFQRDIGFGRIDPQSARALMRLAHLRRFAQQTIALPLVSLLQGIPNPEGYFLGGFGSLERDRPDFAEGRRLVAERLTQIRQVAESIGAKLVVLMLPAPVQVCAAPDLAYYPQHVDLSDTTRFDLELPQRVTEEIAAALNIPAYDVRPALRGERCPFQPRNLHWLAEGHRAVAAFVAEKLANDAMAIQAAP